MHLHALETYRPASSPLHRLDPRVKTLLALALILTAALIPDRRWGALAALQVMLLWATVCSRVGLGLVQRRAVAALPFTLAALTVIFATPGRALLTLPLPGGPWIVTDAGLVRFVAIVARAYVSIQGAVLLAATTPFPDLLQALRAFGLPRLLVAMTGFLYRYLFVLADEAQRMMQARRARSTRSLRPTTLRSLAWRARVTGSMAGVLFIRAYERGERIYLAMLARGYDGETRALSTPALRRMDLLAGGCAGALLGAVLILARK